MISTVLITTALGLGAGAIDLGTPTMYDPRRDARPIATLPAPEINGRLWVSPPVIGPQPGPFIPQFPSPGPEHYGAIDHLDARIPVRVGHLVVSISPWERIDKPGLRRFEEARQFWLNENNFTGGVRTFIDDRHLWEAPGQHASADVETFDNAAPDAGSPLPPPRATIKVPEDLPRKRPPLRVEATPGAPEALVLLSDEPVHISWPHAAPSGSSHGLAQSPTRADHQ